MASLSLKHIFKVYDGKVKAVNDFSMDINDKEFIVFVGPSGCGKSTTLRMIAGLEDITAGELRIDDEIVNDYEPKDRNIAMVFQNYALYPHMSVYENMAFSLRTAHVPDKEIYIKVTEAAEILGITEYLDRKPKALSGGQRQRVALGRAIVRNPKVFLLDEPLSNLDAKLRTVMRTEISRLHERLETTFIYVTHDQVEAMTMGTRIVVMKDGYVQQIDTPVNLYKYPDNMFVAGFIGTPQMNFFDSTIEKVNANIYFNLDCGARLEVPYKIADKIPLKYMDNKAKVVLGLRPDAVRMKSNKFIDDGLWAPNKAIVSAVEVLGGETIVYANLNIDNIDSSLGAVILKADPDVFIKRGDIIDIEISKRKFHVFDKETERSIRRRIPQENIIKCDIADGKISFQNQLFDLPDAIKREDIYDVEMTMPIDALTIGNGKGKAEIEWIEEIQNKTLYFLKVEELTLFSIEEGTPKYKIGDKVNFDIDLCKIAIEECNIKPLTMVNELPGNFIKVKNKQKEYDFYIQIGSTKLVPSTRICEKLFACKGTKIFNTDLLYEFNTSDLSVRLYEEELANHRLVGIVKEVFDYGTKKYAKIDVESGIVLAKYDGKVNDKVMIDIDVDKITIKDKVVNIIIV